MLEIIPAIMPVDFADLESKMSLVNGLVKIVQIDIMDGKFVPSATWPYKKPDENFEAILREERGMPYWQHLDFEVDLMIGSPEDEVERWMRAGASRIIIHVESSRRIRDAIGQVKGLVEVGLAISPTTDSSVLDEYVEDADFVQFMGIDKIGFQGNPFDDTVIDKIKTFKKLYPKKIVSVDGGVSEETIARLKEAGVERFVAGSAIFESRDVNEAILHLKQCI